MKNKIIVATALTALALGLTTPAHAADQKRLVIIDSGVNTQLDWVKKSLVDEACFIEYGKCPNGQSSMTGLGAANINPASVNDKAMHHGTQMYSVAVQANPNVQVVFIRIVGMSDKGYANSYTTKAVRLALDWVAVNAARLNVGAVSMSIGRSYKEVGCPSEPDLAASVQKLTAAGIGVFGSAGNDGNKTKVSYPACIPAVIAVGATDTPYAMRGVAGWVTPVMPSSNGGVDLDLYAMGRWTTRNLSDQASVSLGTSNATVAVASKATQILSEGKSLASLTENLGKAYISLKDVILKLFLI